MPRFLDAIAGKHRISVVAEVKRRSPSYGRFPEHNLSNLLHAYERGGAAAISVVTDPIRFDGSIELLHEASKRTKLPILRKDFLKTEADMEETAQSGASAVLLIARMLSKEKLHQLVLAAQKRNLDPVLELHTEEDLAKIAGLRDVVLGINNRDLETFQTNVHHAQRLLEKIPSEFPIIIESGFSRAEELKLYAGKIDAVLIGTSLLMATDQQKTLQTFTSLYARRPRPKSHARTR